MNREFRVGLMFVISLSVLGLALFFLGSFQENISYKVQFSKVNGLAVDSPVHFNGVPIGRVTKIVLSTETPAAGPVPIIVTLAVHRSLREHIRSATRADIRSIGILGDKYILLLTPNYSGDPLEEGANIPPMTTGLDVDKLLEQGTDFVTDATQITENLKQFIGQLANEDGVLQRLIKDKTLADEMQKTLTNLLAQMRRDDNLLAVMLKDPQFARAFKSDLNRLMAGMSNIVEQYEKADGLLPSLINDETYREEVQTKLTSFLDLANGYMTRLSESRGLLYKLTEDEAYGEQIAANLEKASRHLASILEKIDEGDGSAALVVNDPSLYQGLHEVVYGLKNSGLSSWYIRKKQKKGEKLLDQSNEQPKQEDKP